MQFSLLVANYNNGKFFKECYNSIINQTNNDWEVIIVDDYSTDDSVQTIKNIIGTDNRFHLFENEKNYGVAYTKKRCIALANKSWCGFLDPDDALATDALNTFKHAMAQHSQFVLFYSTCFWCDEELAVQKVYEKSRQVENGDLFFFNLSNPILHFVLFSKECYNTTLGLDTYMQRAIDQDLYLKLWEKGAFYFINQPLYYYRRHQDSLSHQGISNYWHWFAIIQASKRRGINLEKFFNQHFVSRRELEKVNKQLQKELNKTMYSRIKSRFGTLLRGILKSKA